MGRSHRHILVFCLHPSLLICKFAGSAVGFKLEAAIELIEGLEVVVLNPTDIKESLRRNPIAVPFSDTGLKQFQETAFTTAYAWLMKRDSPSQT